MHPHFPPKFWGGGASYSLENMLFSTSVASGAVRCDRVTGIEWKRQGPWLDNQVTVEVARRGCRDRAFILQGGD